MEDFGIFTAGHPFPPPVPYLFADFGVDRMPLCYSLWNRLGEIYLAVYELVAKQVDIFRSVAKALGNNLGRQALDKRSTQGFVATLPVEFRIEEEFSIWHRIPYTL